MNEIQQYQQAKERCLDDLERHLPGYANRLNAIDPRLMIYAEDAVSNRGSHANLMELLGIRKELRLMDSYRVNADRVKLWLRAIEGVWQKGQHVKGGLKFDTPRGNDHVMLMPYQVWCVFGIYGFDTEVDMERPWSDYEKHEPTEYRGDNGNVWDVRRLCQEAHLFQTRKSGKTEFGAALDFVEATILGPANAQALICANSRDQAKIAYKAIKQFAYQVDPSCLNRMGGNLFRVTADEMNWQPGHKRKGEIKVMSAGGKRKDGLYASQVHPDEHGSAEYINGAADMQELVDVCWGSTGPRREKLLLHTTTAGRIKEGPYKNQLETVEDILLTELDHPLGDPCRTEDDKWFAFMLQLDKWEVGYDLDQLDDPELFRKVNRSIGITVQPTYYKERLHDARMSEDTKKEVLSKDFNIWQGNRITKWLTGDQIRPRQIERRITDCKYQEGWERVFVGLDFGGNDDLFAVTYLGVNYWANQPIDQRMFADCEAWIVEKALKESPNRHLYEKWIEQGWLKMCPGEVFIPDMAINDLMAKNDQGLNLYCFGYDPAQSIQPINTIKAWLQTLFQEQGVSQKEIPALIKKMVVPVPQSFVAQNGIIQKLEWLLLGQEFNAETGGWLYTNDTPFLYLSNSPLWPFCFGNAKVEVSSSELRAIRKSAHHSKIDPIHALMDALHVYDLSEGQVQV